MHHGESFIWKAWVLVRWDKKGRVRPGEEGRTQSSDSERGWAWGTGGTFMSWIAEASKARGHTFFKLYFSELVVRAAPNTASPSEKMFHYITVITVHLRLFPVRDCQVTVAGR